jgi:tRNA (cytidine56-2'-O)-methyltransferase
LSRVPEKSIRVLRIGHRHVRDYRVLTHLCLVSRAFGADRIYLEEIDDGLVESVEKVNEAWGGDFEVEKVSTWKSALNAAKKEGRVTVHLTMYGMPLRDVVSELRAHDSLLIAVGGPKVPGEVYKLADYNVAVSSQPHSEIAALAVLLHDLQNGEELKKEFSSPKMKIIPSEKGKRIENLT